MPERISKEEFIEWKNSRGTKQFVEDLFNTREELKEGIVEMRHSTEEDRCIAIGRAQALKDTIDHIIYNINYQLEESQQDDMESGSAQNHS